MSADARTAAASGQEVTVRRILDAPIEKVWRAWTEPAAFAHWFSTPPYETPVETVSLDVRAGGEWRATQVSKDTGEELPFLGHYQEVEEPERLVFTFEDPSGGTADVETGTLTLRPLDGMTEMTFRQAGHLPPQQYPLLAQGYTLFFDRMEEYLRRT